MSFTAEKSKPSRTTIFQGFALTVLLFFLISLGVRSIIGVIGVGEWSATSFIISRFCYWAWLGIIFIYVWFREKKPLLLWPETKRVLTFYAASIFGIIISIFIGNVVIGKLLMYLGLYKRSSAMLGVAGFSFLLKVFISFTAAVVEEFVFRGYMMPRLQLFFKSKHWPVIVTSVLFGLAHMRWGTIINVVGPVFIGLLFAYHYQKYRNIKVIMACHLLWDIIGLMLIPHATK